MKKLLLLLLIVVFATPILACIDNDFGINVQLQGYCYDLFDNEGTDYCGEDGLVEYYCDGDYCKSIIQACSECSAGVCYDGEGNETEPVNDTTTGNETDEGTTNGGTTTGGEEDEMPEDNKAPDAELRVFVLKEPGKVKFRTEFSDPDGDAVSYTLDFGDDSSVETLNPLHEYSKPGEYIVTMTVIDSWGLKTVVTDKVVIELNLIDTGKMMIASEELCTDEFIAQLLAKKAELEKQADELKKDIEETKKDIEEAGNNLKDLDTKINDLGKEIEDNKKDLDTTGKEIDKTGKEIDNLNDEIEKADKRLEQLQDILSMGEGVDQYSGNDPIGGMESGGAISFDGGHTWVRGQGNAGVEQIIDNLRKHKDALKEVKELGKKLKDLRKKKEDAENKKKELEDKKTDLEKKIEQGGKDLEQAKKDKDEQEKNKGEAEKKLEEQKKEAEELSKKIEQFNEIAKQCGIKARNALLDALSKLNKMPDDLKKAAEEKFEEDATDEEEGTKDDPYGGDTEEGGSTEGGTATKLYKAMKAVSQCPPPDTKRYPKYEKDYQYFTKKGVEGFTLTNMQDSRGNTMKTQAEVINGIATGIGLTTGLDDVTGAAELYKYKNPVNLGYSYWQNEAADAIVDKLKEWQTNKKVAGMPYWFEFEYGRVWEIKITETKSYEDVYKCKNGIWQYSHVEYELSYSRGPCEYKGSGTYRHNVDHRKLDFTGCSLGSCPNAWPDAYKDAVNTLLNQRLRNDIVGECPE